MKPGFRHIARAAALIWVVMAGAHPREALPSGHPVRLLFTGDILLSRYVETEITRRKISPWQRLGDLFRAADWAAGNFEGAVGSPPDCLPPADACFAVQESSVFFLKSAGFKGMTFENNHAGDLGPAGRQRTLDALERAGITAADFEHSPRFVRLGNLDFAFLALTKVPAADGKVQELPSPQTEEKLRMARKHARFVIVSIHWGHEYLPWPSATQRKDAAWLIEHGADLIVGHHPHVIQPAECVSGRPVFFSLGNHVFDQSNSRTKEGLIADCHVQGTSLRCQGLRTHTRSGSSFPMLTGPDRNTNFALVHCGEKLPAQ